MTKIEFLTKALENANGDIGEIIGLDCRLCPLRAECRKAEEESAENLSCYEWLNKVLTD